jgi:hypothetical protein
VLVLVLENPDRFAIRLTEQNSCKTSVSLRSPHPNAPRTSTTTRTRTIPNSEFGFTRGGLKDSTSFWIPTAAGTSAWVASPQDRGIDPRTGLLHVATTCTETSIRSKAPGSPSQLPESGDAFSCSRATATATCSEPTGLLLVGSKPSQPLPGT